MIAILVLITGSLNASVGLKRFTGKTQVIRPGVQSLRSFKVLIVLEGIDGMGKTTIMNQLSVTGRYKTKEPGSPLITVNQTLRELCLKNKTLSAFERELLFYVDASQHAKVIESLSPNGTVISDRGLWSHFAYLYGTLKTKQMDWDQYSLCKKVINQVCARPDAVIYFKGTVDLMKTRMDEKEKDAIESSGDSFYQWVLSAYDDLLEFNKSLPTLIVDGFDTIDNNLRVCEDFINHVSRGISENPTGIVG